MTAHAAQAAQRVILPALDALCAEIELRITAAIVTRAMMAAGALILVSQYLMKIKAVAGPSLPIRS